MVLFHNERVRCIQITDIHLDLNDRNPNEVPVWDNFAWALEAARSMSPDLVVLTGDIALDRGDVSLYQEVNPLLERVGTDTLLLPGNHDNREEFARAFGRRYRLGDDQPYLDRTVESAGRTMLLLDTADHVVHTGTLLWFDARLAGLADAAGRGEHSGRVLVWMHHPMLSGFHRFMDTNYPLKNGDDLVQICRRYRKFLVVTVLCGHYHTEHRAVEENVTQYCTPSTYMQLDPDTPELRIANRRPAIRVVELDQYDRVTTTIVEPADQDGPFRS